ncbi:MAG: restriction endonuclease subunit S, partial [Moraxellaceae bacterium]
GPQHWGTEGTPIIKIKEMTGGISSETPYYNGEDVGDKYRFTDGDIIFSWSATLLVKIWNEGPGFLNQHLFKVLPRQDIPRDFLFLSIKFCLPIFESLTTGSTMKHIKRKELSMVKIPVAVPDLLIKFHQIVHPMVEEILILAKEIELLTKTKDLLLPRLISGKLSVENLDIQFPPSMQETI